MFGVLVLLVTPMVVGVNAQDDDDDDTEFEETEDETGDEDDDEDDDDDGVDDDVEDENEREVQVEVQDDEATIESSRDSGENEESIEIGVKASSDGVEFSLEFETENDTTERELEFEVTFYEIVEFIDEDDDGVYNESVDTMIQTYMLDTFEPIDYTAENRTDGMVHILEVTTTDGVFTARVYATGEFADINGTTIAPNQVKIDVIIDGFDYQNDTSQLALKVELEAEAEKEYDDETEDEEEGRATDEEGIDFTSNQYSGFFTWKESATVDGVDHPVEATIHEASDNEQEMFLNYPRGERIVHDPKIGVANILQTPNGIIGGVPDLGGYLPVIAIVGAIVVIGVVIKIRR
jgi:hypothetical protein